ncbi:hypothetical protein LTR74_018202 [Friedmanniomyces endolithicus]|nr:hypothetical protein LTR74_018202 [Friedmanniomyces endolithicus]
MVTWLIIGAARGIETSTFVEADLFNPESLKKAADEVTAKTDGKLDVLIHNAFSAGTEAMLYKPTEFTGRERELQNEISEAIKGNVLGPIYIINAFLPLLRKGTEKKIIYISTGAGDIELIRVSGQPGQLGYASSKAAGNAVIAKYAAELADEGIKTLSLSPGWVNTDAAQMLQQNEVMFNSFLKSFQKVDPNLKGPISVQESVQAQLAVIASLDAATSGRFLTHRGDATSWF